jgi:hypothetical protein
LEKAVAPLELVRIDNRTIGKPEKFILAKIEGTDTVVLRANGHAQFHKDIYQELLSDTDFKLKINVTGGGRIYYSEYDTTIWVWGESTQYGVPDWDQTVALLQKRYPDFKVTALPLMDKGALRESILEDIVRGDIYKFVEPLKELGKNEGIVDGKTALHIAVEFDSIEAARKAIDIGQKPRLKDDKNRTPLELAEFLAKRDSLRYTNLLKSLKELLKNKY